MRSVTKDECGTPSEIGVPTRTMSAFGWRWIRVVLGSGVVAGTSMLSSGCDRAPEYVAASQEAGGGLGVHIAICGDELVESVGVYANWRKVSPEPLWRVEIDPPAQIRHFIAAEPLPAGVRRTHGEETFIVPEGVFVLSVEYANRTYRSDAAFTGESLEQGMIYAEWQNIDASEFDDWEADVCSASDEGGLWHWFGEQGSAGKLLTTLVLVAAIAGMATVVVVANLRTAERKRRWKAAQAVVAEDEARG